MQHVKSLELRHLFSLLTDYIMERTGTSLEYKFLADPLPEGFNSIQFSVKARGEAHILLSTGKDVSEGGYEIGRGNYAVHCKVKLTDL